ncbi:MAG TPA: MarC family protein [Candidatus Nitrosotalea sp.]|nr:MarC family protein [Candidatus Nitrosotalea sp.]
MVQDFFSDLTKSVITLLVVIDPFASVPIIIALTNKMEKKQRVSISNIAIITVAGLLFVFAFIGSTILSTFGISMFSFMIAGGILLFVVAIELLTHGEWRFGSRSTQDESSIVPLAFPLLAGPGALTLVILSYDNYGVWVTLFSIMIVLGITYTILRLVEPIYKLLGKRGTMIVTRTFAIIIAAFAVQFIIDGIKQVFQ